MNLPEKIMETGRMAGKALDSLSKMNREIARLKKTIQQVRRASKRLQNVNETIQKAAETTVGRKICEALGCEVVK